jgi:CDP-diacylglycerol--glycerol-3-phosphate 3-phosphatidyltransferase
VRFFISAFLSSGVDAVAQTRLAGGRRRLALGISPSAGPLSEGNLDALFPVNLPNALTVVRIMLVPALVVALLGNTPAGDVLAAVVFSLASLTDFVDGYLARARDSITTFGKLMDPLADKLLIVAALISLVSLHRLAAWVAMVIITRELAVTVLRLGATQAGVVMGASFFGKVKTCLQIAAILAVIAVHGNPPWVQALIYVTVVVTVLSGLDYFFGLRRRMQRADLQAP